MELPIVVPEDSNNSGAAQAEVAGGTDPTLLCFSKSALFWRI